MGYDYTRLRAPGLYTLNWTKAGGTIYDFGLLDLVEPNFELITAPIQVGSIGDVPLGEWILGLKGKITTALREIDLTTYQKLCPWWASGSISLIPTAVKADLYQYAGLLTLHPTDIAAATVTQDINLLKAVPRPIALMKRDGKKKEEQLVVEWTFWPDRAQLTQASPLMVYGYIGTPP